MAGDPGLMLRGKTEAGCGDLESAEVIIGPMRADDDTENKNIEGEEKELETQVSHR